MIIATAGHIDHGKSSLVKAITGIETDRLPEEKKRGLSIDLGFAYQSINKGITLGFVDVPGHEKFIKNMLVGVTGIDYAMLVVAADDGPMPQTLEHLAILDLLNVSEGIVVLTKVDRVTEERVKIVRGQVNDILKGTCLIGSDIFPVSTLTGSGVNDVSDHLSTMAELLGQRDVEGYFRLAIDRAFTIPGAGVVVTGSVLSGQVNVGDNLIISPHGTHVRVRRIHAQNKETSIGLAGQRCAVNITGGQLNKFEIRRGSWLLAKEIHAPVLRFDARVRILSSEVKALTHWTPVHVHLGSAEITGRVALLEKKAIDPDKTGLVQIVLDRRISGLKNDRFILRDQSARRTIGGGAVIDPFSPTRGRAKAERINFLKAMELSPPDVSVRELLDQLPSGLNLSKFFQSSNLTETAQQKIIETVRAIRIRNGDQLIAISPGFYDEIADAIVGALKNWHLNNSNKPGLAQNNLHSLLLTRTELPVFDSVLKNLVEQGKVLQSGSTYSLPGFKSKMSEEDEVIWKKLLPILQRGHTQPPVVHALADEVNMEPRVVERFLVRSARLGLLYQVAKNRFLLPEALYELASIVEELGAKVNNFEVKQFRDRSGIGRNLAIEVLEFFDKSGLTSRSDDTRKIITKTENIFGVSLDK